MPHGFLSYNIPMFGMRDESMQGILTGVKWLKELAGDIDLSINVPADTSNQTLTIPHTENADGN